MPRKVPGEVDGTSSSVGRLPVCADDARVVYKHVDSAMSRNDRIEPFPVVGFGRVEVDGFDPLAARHVLDVAV
jgi:hypothetical protein